MQVASISVDAFLNTRKLKKDISALNRQTFFLNLQPSLNSISTRSPQTTTLNSNLQSLNRNLARFENKLNTYQDSKKSLASKPVSNNKRLDLLKTSDFLKQSNRSDKFLGNIIQSSFKAGIKELIKSQKTGFLSRITSIISSPFKALFSGVFLNIGETISGQFQKSFNKILNVKSLNLSQKVDNFTIKSFEFFKEKGKIAFEELSNALNYKKISDFKADITKAQALMFDFFDTTFDARKMRAVSLIAEDWLANLVYMLKNAQKFTDKEIITNKDGTQTEVSNNVFKQIFSDNLKDPVDNILQKSLKRLEAFQTIASTEMSKQPKELKKAFIQYMKDTKSKGGIPDFNEFLEQRGVVPKRELQLIGLLVKALGHPLRFKNKVIQREALDLAREQVATRGVKLPGGMPNLEGKENVVLTMGGFQQLKGKGGADIANVMSPLFNEKTAVIPVPNTYTDRSPNDTESELLNLLVDLTGGKISKDMVFTIQNFEKLLGTSFKGFNPDSVRIASIAAAIQEKYPDIKISGTAFSGGVYPMEQGVQLANQLGVPMTGVGVGAGLYGQSGWYNPNYTALIGKEDPLTFPFQFVSPTANTTVIPGFATAPSMAVHDPKLYYSDPTVRSEMERQMPGYVGSTLAPEYLAPTLALSNRINKLTRMQGTIDKFFADPDSVRTNNLLDAFNEVADAYQKQRKASLSNPIDDSNLNALLSAAGAGDQSVLVANAVYEKNAEYLDILGKFLGKKLQIPEEILTQLSPEDLSSTIRFISKAYQEIPQLQKSIRVGSKVIPEEEGVYSFFTSQSGQRQKRLEDFQGLLKYLKKDLNWGGLPDIIQNHLKTFEKVLNDFEKVLKENVDKDTEVPKALLELSEALHIFGKTSLKVNRREEIDIKKRLPSEFSTLLKSILAATGQSNIKDPAFYSKNNEEKASKLVDYGLWMENTKNLINLSDQTEEFSSQLKDFEKLMDDFHIALNNNIKLGTEIPKELLKDSIKVQKQISSLKLTPREDELENQIIKEFKPNAIKFLKYIAQFSEKELNNQKAQEISVNLEKFIISQGNKIQFDKITDEFNKKLEPFYLIIEEFKAALNDYIENGSKIPDDIFKKVLEAQSNLDSLDINRYKKPEAKSQKYFQEYAQKNFTPPEVRDAQKTSELVRESFKNVKAELKNNIDEANKQATSLYETAKNAQIAIKETYKALEGSDFATRWGSQIAQTLGQISQVIDKLDKMRVTGKLAFDLPEDKLKEKISEKVPVDLGSSYVAKILESVMQTDLRRAKTDLSSKLAGTPLKATINFNDLDDTTLQELTKNLENRLKKYNVFFEITPGEIDEKAFGAALKATIESFSEDSDTEINQLGQDIFSGLIEGIKDKLSVGEEELSKINQAIIQKMKDDFEIRSPSRITYHIGEAVAEGFIQGFDLLKEFMKNLPFGDILYELFEEAQAGIKGFTDSIGFDLTSVLGDFAGLAIAGTIVTTFSGQLFDLVDSAKEVTREFNGFKRTFSFALGGGEIGNNFFDDFTEKADKLGLSMQSALEGASQFLPATLGTPLEGQGAIDTLNNLQEFFAVRSTSRDATQRAFAAIIQSASKGQIYAEEIIGQLAEAAPGAVGIFARSQGQDIPSFLNRMRQGGVGSEALIGFAQQAAIETSSDLPKRLESASAIANRAENSFLRLQNSIGGVGLEIEKIVNKIKTIGFDFIDNNLSNIVKLSTSLIATLAAPGLMRSITLIKLFGTELIKIGKDQGIRGIGTQIKSWTNNAVISGLKTFVKQFLLINTVVEVANRMSMAFKNMSGDLKNFTQQAKLAQEELSKLTKNNEKTSQNTTVSSLERWWVRTIRGFDPGVVFRELLGEESLNDKDLDRLYKKNKKGFLNPFDNSFEEKVKRLKDSRLELAKLINLAKNLEKISKNTRFNNSVDQVISIDKKLTQIQEDKKALVVLEPNNTKKIKELFKIESEIVKKRYEALKPSAALQSQLSTRIDQLKKTSKILEKQRNEGLISSKEFIQQSKEVESVTKSLEEILENILKKLGLAATAFDLLKRQIIDSNIALEDTLGQITDISNATKISLASRNLTSGDLNFSKELSELVKIEGELQAQISTVDLKENLFNFNEVAQRTLKAFGVGAETGVAKIREIAERTESEQSKYLLEQYADFRDEQDALAETRISVLELRKALQDTIKDQLNQVLDFYKEQEKSLVDAKQEYKKALLTLKQSKATDKIATALIGSDDELISAYADLLIAEIESANNLAQAQLDKVSSNIASSREFDSILKSAQDLSKSIPGVIEITLDYQNIDKMILGFDKAKEIKEAIKYKAKDLNDLINKSKTLYKDVNNQLEETESSLKGSVTETENLEKGFKNLENVASGINNQFDTLVGKIVKTQKEIKETFKLNFEPNFGKENSNKLLSEKNSAQKFFDAVNKLSGNKSQKIKENLDNKTKTFVDGVQNLFNQVVKKDKEKLYASPSAKQSFDQVLKGSVSPGQAFWAKRLNRRTGKRTRIHSGIDFDSTEGLTSRDVVQAMFPGVIKTLKGWGRGTTDKVTGRPSNAIRVVSQLPGRKGQFYTDYGHMDMTTLKDLKPGQQIGAGKRLGKLSVNDKWSSGGHLDLKIRIPNDIKSLFKDTLSAGQGYSYVDVKQFMKWYKKQADAIGKKASTNLIENATTKFKKPGKNTTENYLDKFRKKLPPFPQQKAPTGGNPNLMPEIRRGGNDLSENEIKRLTSLGKRLYGLRNNPNILALSDAVARAEGTDFRKWTKNFGYGMLIGNENISDFSGHPFVEGGRPYRYNSSASGRYQMMDFNYSRSRVKRQFGKNARTDLESIINYQGQDTPKSFSPGLQDLYFIASLHKRGVLDKVLKGNFDQGTFNKIAPHWASIQYKGRKSYYGGQGTPEGQFKNIQTFTRKRLAARQKEPGVKRAESALSVLEKPTKLTEESLEAHKKQLLEFISKYKKPGQVKSKPGEINLEEHTKKLQDFIIADRKQKAGERGNIPAFQKAQTTIKNATELAKEAQQIKNQTAEIQKQNLNYSEQVKLIQNRKKANLAEVKEEKQRIKKLNDLFGLQKSLSQEIDPLKTRLGEFNQQILNIDEKFLGIIQEKKEEIKNLDQNIIAGQELIQIALDKQKPLLAEKLKIGVQNLKFEKENTQQLIDQLPLIQSQTKEKLRSLFTAREELELSKQAVENDKRRLSIQQANQSLLEAKKQIDPTLSQKDLVKVQNRNELEQQRVSYQEQLNSLQEKRINDPNYSIEQYLKEASGLSKVNELTKERLNLIGKFNQRQAAIQDDEDKLTRVREIEDLANNPAFQRRQLEIDQYRGNPFIKNRMSRELEREQENLRYKRELEDLELNQRKLIEANNAIPDNVFAKMKEDLAIINQMNLESINQKFKTFGDTLNEVGANAMQNLATGITDIIMGTSSLENVLDNFFNSILSQVLNTGLTSIFGGLFGGLFYEGGMVGRYPMGGRIPYYPMGGKIPYYAEGGTYPRYSQGLMDGLRKERSESGRDPRLAIVHEGELIIPADRTEELMRAGLTPEQLLGNLPSYANGGLVSTTSIPGRNQQTNMTVEYVSIGEMDYVTKEQFDQGIQQASRNGAEGGYNKVANQLRNDVNFRRNVGLQG